MADGRFYDIDGDEAYKVYFDKYHVNSRHFTFLFNTFVLFQCFNFFSCRRINDELNIFEGIFGSGLFWFILMIILIFQVIIVEFLNEFFNLYSYGGLTAEQWLISIGISALTVPVSILIRLLPCCKPNDENKNEIEIDEDPHSYKAVK